MTSLFVHGPTVTFRRRRPLLRCPRDAFPRAVPALRLPAAARNADRALRRELATAATGTALENRSVWVAVINAMLIPTKTMGERPCESIYNQLMKNATPIRLIITMKNHPENTQETRPGSHCLLTGKAPPFKRIPRQNLCLEGALASVPETTQGPRNLQHLPLVSGGNTQLGLSVGSDPRREPRCVPSPRRDPQVHPQDRASHGED